MSGSSVDSIFPSQFADQIGESYTETVTSDFKKAYGQFLTPVEIARFMATLSKVRRKTLSILDPGCGTGVLTCALVEHAILTSDEIKEISITAFELDTNSLPKTEKAYSELKQWARGKGVKLDFRIQEEDFVLSNSHYLTTTQDLFGHLKEKSKYDIIISNPPYFKIPKDDPRAKATATLNKGQPNIYAIFLGLAAHMLSEHGELIFITPRSFTAGPYFERFRKVFFSKIELDHVHVFDSRNKAFGRDKVLQENIIFSGRPLNGHAPSSLIISSSLGMEDLNALKVREYKYVELLGDRNGDNILFLPTTDLEDQVLQIFGNWKDRLGTLDIGISTGPVVSFRATEHLREATGNSIVPLLWLPNVRKMQIDHPITKKGKSQFIESSEASRPLLVRNRNYVLLRRFSAKDDKSRLVAAPYFSTGFEIDFIGLENHLNYLYGLTEELSEELVIGLAGLLNSTLFDLYFRMFNGNTQVSATELRNMPFPPIEFIELLGQKLHHQRHIEQELIDQTVSELLNSTGIKFQLSESALTYA
ncbi:MAG: Eco57I restriction-modification methylase domain-containing protein [Bacteroidota bacterium]